MNKGTRIYSLDSPGLEKLTPAELAALEGQVQRILDEAGRLLPGLWNKRIEIADRLIRRTA